MSLLQWWTRDEYLRAPYRLLDEVPGLSYGEGDQRLLVPDGNPKALKAPVFQEIGSQCASLKL